MTKFNQKFYLLFKRFIDLVFAVLAILILSPLFLLIIFLILIFQGRPIFFRQLRPGFKSKPFKIIKFCSMRFVKDENGNLLTDDKRITKLGNILRKSSLDEIPSLINILRGEMSFIGPRPLLMEYLELYNKDQKRRHNVKPGFSGLAQINGRNSLTWEEKFKYDIKYVDNISFSLDIRIFIKTIFYVIFRQNINFSLNETMPVFRGNLGDNYNE